MIPQDTRVQSLAMCIPAWPNQENYVTTYAAHDAAAGASNLLVEQNVMIKAIDIKAELARLPFLHGRGKDTTELELCPSVSNSEVVAFQ